MRAAPTGWHPESRFTTVAGVRCHYVDVGPRDAPTLVLVHGIAVSSWAWRFNLPTLARHFRVIAPCQKGFGWSGRDRGDYSVGALARFVLGLLDHLGVARADLCGNSLGGAVALWIAEHHPERVRRLVLENAAALADQRPWHLLHTQVPALGPLYRALIGPTLFRAGLMALAYKNLAVDSDYMAGFWTPLAAPRSIQTLLAVARRLPASLAEVDRLLPTVRHPALIAWGQKDGVLPVSGAYALHRQLPASRLVLYPASGHCPHEEEPARFDAMLVRFLDPDPPLGATADVTRPGEADTSRPHGSTSRR
ncbi:MAG: hypothetical protein CVU56_14695 [Deltaproteobacteria bacterium HGW-Deltaproteobacteria-14]|jgi:pimeloyl-ACP methyl ester carboxylesterase|nr:MAG: hypothetical protein CVU56_14695 [Deltaproteobacteria bacterium HGW-Deltaproteobacteria-14]